MSRENEEIIDAELVEPDYSATEVYTGPHKKPRGTRKKDHKLFYNSKDKLLSLVGMGNPANYACGIVGISPQTLQKWLQRGRAIQDSLDAEEDLDPVDKDYAEFCVDYGKLYFAPRAQLLRVQMEAALGDEEKGIKPNPHWAYKLHAKMDPEQFGERQTIDTNTRSVQDVYIHGSRTLDGGSGEEVAKQLTTEELRLLRADLKKKKQKVLEAGDAKED